MHTFTSILSHHEGKDASKVTVLATPSPYLQRLITREEVPPGTLKRQSEVNELCSQPMRGSTEEESQLPHKNTNIKWAGEEEEGEAVVKEEGEEA